jgi:hypothetical protein|eukprot:SAG25_NODE_2815_length_1372_cov_1.532600_1_plen_112_part_00
MNVPVRYHGAGVAATWGALGATATKKGLLPGATSCSHAIDLLAIMDVVYPANSPLVLALYEPALPPYRAPGETGWPPLKSEKVALRKPPGSLSAPPPLANLMTSVQAHSQH